MPVSVICPVCSRFLHGDIFDLSNAFPSKLFCSGCKKIYRNNRGCFDFTPRSTEKNFYEKKYANCEWHKCEDLDFRKLKAIWYDNSSPERRIFIDNLGRVEGKEILLLGNGCSDKELCFLQCNNIVYSDMSLSVVSRMSQRYDYFNQRYNICFHAFDASRIPLNNATIDIVIGYSFVHHLQDYDKLMREIFRILKPGGRCLFYDSAYSVLWQKLKFGLFKPAVSCTHKKWGISPGDFAATHRGGYRRTEIVKTASDCGFSDFAYVRFGFLYQIFRRGMVKLLGESKIVDNIMRVFVPIFYKIDSCLAVISKSYYENTINLVWGFTK